jgi:hypothetical protein
MEDRFRAKRVLKSAFEAEMERPGAEVHFKLPIFHRAKLCASS